MVNINISCYQGTVLETMALAEKKGRREIIVSTNEATWSTVM